MQKLKEITLDAREMEHPKPLEYAMRALRELNDANYLYMIHRKNPIPLLDLANEHNFKTISEEDSQGVWHIVICKNRDIHIDKVVEKYV